MTIKVLGPGCSNCKKLYEATKVAIKDIDCDIDLEYVTDIEKMVSYGIMSSPALMIDEKVVSQGRLLNKNDIVKLIKSNEVIKPTEGTCDCGGKC